MHLFVYLAFITILSSYYLLSPSAASPPKCLNGGYLSEDNSTCICPKYFDRRSSNCSICLCPNCITFGTNHCECKPGWKGKFCEDIDCSKGVLDPSTNLTCICKPGYSGSRCREVNCKNGAQKLDYHGYYKLPICVCWDDFEGEFCELITCYNGGSRRIDNESCYCNKGYEGTNCQQRVPTNGNYNETFYIYLAILLGCIVVGCCFYMCRKWALKGDDHDGEPVPLATRIARRITSSDSAGPRAARYENDPLARATAPVMRDSEDGPPRYSTEVERGQILNESDELPPPSYDDALAMK